MQASIRMMSVRNLLLHFWPLCIQLEFFHPHPGRCKHLKKSGRQDGLGTFFLSIHIVTKQQWMVCIVLCMLNNSKLVRHINCNDKESSPNKDTAGIKERIVCTLLSLLQLIKRFKLHVIRKRKLTLVSRGNID